MPDLASVATTTILMGDRNSSSLAMSFGLISTSRNILEIPFSEVISPLIRHFSRLLNWPEFVLHPHHTL